ncbi:MAG: arginase family protein [Dehalococcoidia bacterium]
MPRLTVLDAPSILGLRPTGVERLPEALRSTGLLEQLDAEDAGRVEPLNDRYSFKRDPATLLLNAEAIGAFSQRLAGALDPLVRRGRFPRVLGGDCSILLGALLALRRLGRYGLVFLDGHADFYQPEASTTGEVADMDLALASGRGPAVLADLDGRRPLIRDEDVVVLGYRDAEAAAADGSQDVRETAMHVLDLQRVRALGAESAATTAAQTLARRALAGFWIHLDADVLDDAVMPAVDYRLAGGLNVGELSAIVRVLVTSGRAIGLSVAIYNPALDPDGIAGRRLAAALVAGLTPA